MYYLTFIIAIATAFAACSAWKTALETKRIVQAQIVIQIRGQLNSIEIPTDIKERRLLGFNNWEQFAKELEIAAILEKPDHLIFYNWIINYYKTFHKLAILLSSRCVKESFLRSIIMDDEVEMLLQIIEPIEKKINIINDSYAFNIFKKLYAGRLGHGDLG